MRLTRIKKGTIMNKRLFHFLLVVVTGMMPCMAVAEEPTTTAKTAPPSQELIISEVRRRVAELVPLPQGSITPVFSPGDVQAYQPKGATRCFRQLCYD
jgi:hypothetical protein